MSTLMTNKAFFQNSLRQLFQEICESLCVGQADQDMLGEMEVLLCDPESLVAWCEQCVAAEASAWSGFPSNVYEYVSDSARRRFIDGDAKSMLMEKGLRSAFTEATSAGSSEILQAITTLLLSSEILDNFAKAVFSAPSLSRPWAEALAAHGIEHGVEVRLFDLAAGTQHRIGIADDGKVKGPDFHVRFDGKFIEVCGSGLTEFVDRVVTAALFRVVDGHNPFAVHRPSKSNDARLDGISFATWREHLRNADSVNETESLVVVSEQGTCRLRLPVSPELSRVLVDKVVAVAVTKKIGPADRGETDRSGGNEKKRNR
jgi:hypothetical protein